MFSHTNNPQFTTSTTTNSTQMQPPSATVQSIFPFNQLTIAQQAWWIQQQYLMQHLTNTNLPQTTVLPSQTTLFPPQLPASLPLTVSNSAPGEKPTTVKTKRKRTAAPKQQPKTKKTKQDVKEEESKTEAITESLATATATSSPLSTPTTQSSPLPTFLATATPIPTPMLPLNPKGIANYGVRTHSSNPKATNAQLREEIETLCKQITILREHYSGFESNFKMTTLKNMELATGQGTLIARIHQLENELILKSNPPQSAQAPLSPNDELNRLRIENAFFRERLSLYASLESDKNYTPSLPSLEESVATPSSLYSGSALPGPLQPQYQDHPPALPQSPYGFFVGRTLDQQSPVTTQTAGLISSNMHNQQTLSPDFLALTRRASREAFNMFNSPPWTTRQLQQPSTKADENTQSHTPGMSRQGS